MNNKVLSLTDFVKEKVITRGVSNTPLVSPKLKNFCIDYLSMVIDKKFTFYDDLFLSLMKVLKIDKKVCVESIGFNGYDKGYIFDEFINIYTGGMFTAIDGNESTQLELKGEGCRKFEELGGNWIELIEFLLKNRFKAKRIDLAYDDFTGILDYETLIKKVEKHEYVSINKKCPVIMYSKMDNEFKGFSLTFGSRNSSRQLQIYDKKNERLSKNFNKIDCNSWTRLEVRYKDPFASEILEAVLISFYEQNFDLMVKGMINTVVTFKEDYDPIHPGRSKNWKIWDKLLDKTERVKIVRQYDLEKTICVKANWLNRSVSRTLMDLFLSNPSRFSTLINFLIISKIGKIDNSDLNVVNNGKDKYLDNLSYKDEKEFILKLLENLELDETDFDYLVSLLGEDKVNETLSDLKEQYQKYEVD